MRHKKTRFLILPALLCIVFLGLGCLEDPVLKPVTIEPGQPELYEFARFNGNVTNFSTYVLYANGSVMAIMSITNSTRLDIFTPESTSIEFRTEKGPGIKDMVILGNFSTNITENTTFDVIPYESIVTTFSKYRGEKRVHIEIAKPVTGFAGYSYTWEKNLFQHYNTRNETINVVLPPDHNTGNIIFGYPRPRPDKKLEDDEGRVWLVWDEPYPDHPYIVLKYYRSSLPVIMGIVSLVLLTAAALVALFFNNQIRKLQQKRDAIESEMEKEP